MKEIPGHFYAGVSALQSENLHEAEAHFQYILNICPHHAPTLINLGALELKRGEGQTAIAYFTQALVIDENNVMARQNLAATFMHYDRFENAMTHYDELHRQNKLDLEDKYNMGVATMALGRFSDAIAYFHEVLQQIPQHGASLNNLAAIYIRQGKRQEAIPLLQSAIENNPNDECSQFMLNVLQKNTFQLKTSHAYVTNLFNNYAINFDQHLQKTLHYTLPQQSFDILRSLFAEKFQQVLDLGCGTGLSGVAFRGSCEYITGVDLSQKMLAQARTKNIYDALFEADILTFLKETSHVYDVIQALDVLPYFGELEELICAVIPRLNDQGIVLFSAEMSVDQPWKVQDSMRFCHHADYIHALFSSQNMRLLHRSNVISRQENEQDLYVTLFAYQKVADSVL